MKFTGFVKGANVRISKYKSVTIDSLRNKDEILITVDNMYFPSSICRIEFINTILVYEIEIEGDIKIRAGEDQCFKTVYSWRKLKDIQRDDKVLVDEKGYMPVKRVNPLRMQARLINLFIEPELPFIVNGLLTTGKCNDEEESGKETQCTEGS